MLICAICERFLDESDFGNHGLKRLDGTFNKRKECKACRSHVVSQASIIKKADIAPWNYTVCNDCGSVYSKSCKCRKCKSNNVEPYMEL